MFGKIVNIQSNVFLFHEDFIVMLLDKTWRKDCVLRKKHPQNVCTVVLILNTLSWRGFDLCI